MNNIIKKWVEKLRSGEYIQGTGNLNKDGKFCCLGVLCEIAVEEGVTTRFKYWADGSYFSYETLNATSCLPEKLRAWVGLSLKFTQDLMRANDIDKKTFPEIADMIEERFNV